MNVNNVDKEFYDTFSINWNLACAKFGKHHKQYEHPTKFRRTFSLFEEELIMEMYKNGASYSEIADRLNVDVECIGNKIVAIVKSGKMGVRYENV